MKHLTTAGAGYYRAEDPVAPGHIALVAEMAGPPPTFGELTLAITQRMELLPRLRQRVRPTPFGRPLWEDDLGFALTYHLRHTFVPRPGSLQAFAAAASRIAQRPLDLRRPPWELWLVTGLPGDRWALLAKAHRCVVDGIGVQELLLLLFDVCPRTTWVGAAQPWHPHRPPGLARAWGYSLADVLRAPLHWRPSGLPSQLRRMRRALRPPSAGTAPEHPQQRWAQLTVDLDAEAGSGTAALQELILAAVTAGCRNLPSSHDVTVHGTGSPSEIEVGVVAGPSFPLYALGRQVLALYPYLPLAAEGALAVGVMSYQRHVYFGLTAADHACVPDLDAVADGIARSWAEATVS